MIFDKKGYYMFLKLFVTFFGVGLLRPAPGTWGSVAGWCVGICILGFLSPTTLFLACILLSLLGISAVNSYENITKSHDASHIVIDEVAGVWLALAICGQTAIQAVLALVLFRIFDITKPSIIGIIDKKAKGGLGVMGDDVVAGFVAGVFTAMIYALLPKLGIELNDPSISQLLMQLTSRG